MSSANQPPILLILGRRSGDLDGGIARANALGLRTAFSTRLMDSKSALAADIPLSADPRNPRAVLAEVERLGLSNRVGGVVAILEPYVENAAILREALGDGVGGFGPSPGAARTARCKHKMKIAWDSAGVSTPRWRVVRTAKEAYSAAVDLGGTVVVKPCDAWGSAGVVTVRGGDEAVAALQAVREARQGLGLSGPLVALIERRAVGDEFSVEVEMRERARVICVTRKITLGNVEVGHVLPYLLPEEKHRRLCEKAVLAVQSLGIRNCICHLEGFLTSEGEVFYECAARPGGDRLPELIHKVFGVDLLSEAFRIAVGQPSSIPETLEAQCGGVLRFLVPPVRCRLSDQLPEVEGADVRYYKTPGDLLEPVRSNGQRVGSVMVTDRDVPQADARCTKIVENLQQTIFSPCTVKRIV